MKTHVRKICMLGMLTALFVALSMCLRVPVFDNFYLCLGYVAMYFAMGLYGIVGGLTVGVLGTAAYCLLISGIRGMPGWIAGNIVIAIIVGLWIQITKPIQKKALWMPCTWLIIIMANVLGILFCKSITETILYAQPLWLRITTNLPAFISDVAILVLSVPLWKLAEPLLHTAHLINTKQ